MSKKLQTTAKKYFAMSGSAYAFARKLIFQGFWPKVKFDKENGWRVEWDGYTQDDQKQS